MGARRAICGSYSLLLAGWTAAVLLGLSAGCKTSNQGYDFAPEWRSLGLTVTVPAGMFGGGDAVWSATLHPRGPVQTPYTITWDFGGGAEPNTLTQEAVQQSIHGEVFYWEARATVEMQQPSLTESSTRTYTVTAIDANGYRETRSGTYVVSPGEAWATPVIESAAYHILSRQLTVTVSDDDEGQALYVSVTVPSGLAVDAAIKLATPDAPRVAVFYWSTHDTLEPSVSGISTVTVEDETGRSSSVDVEITCQNNSIGADTLLAIPLDTTVTTADQVTVVVATTVPAYPFQYLNSVGVTVETAAEYVRGSFDVGIPDETPDSGGSVEPVDGLWAAMNPGGGFLLAPDNFIQASDIGGGRERWDFNITPIGGTDQTTASGALFNFKLSFGTAGVYHLGFQEYFGVQRTYYSSEDTIFRYWGDLSNDHAGIPNSITVR